jgi:hypothetical protein
VAEIIDFYVTLLGKSRVIVVSVGIIFFRKKIGGSGNERREAEMHGKIS